MGGEEGEIVEDSFDKIEEQYLEIFFFFCVRGSNPGLWIYYALSLSAELSSRAQMDNCLLWDRECGKKGICRRKR